MSVAQSSYSEGIRPAVAGLVANEENYNIITRLAKTAAGIPFGRAIVKGTNPNEVILPSAGGLFTGISVRDVTLDIATPDKYPENANIGLLTEGVIWVVTGGIVVAGNDVSFANATGILSTIAADGSNTAIVGARWEDSAASGELARVRLTGHLPGN